MTVPKISVILISYNQENIIKNALNSIICQKDYLFELIISDDSSTDNTWEVIQSYVEKYPDKIKAYRNENNLGIYENLQGTYDKVTGEIVFFLAGDDEFGKELFSRTCEAISKTDLNYSKDKFCVITDYKVLRPDGSSEIRKNSLVEVHNPFSLKFRNIIANRAFGESISIFNERKKNYIKRKPGSKLSSTLQEGFTDTLPFYLSKNYIYIPYIGNIYRSGIGISTKFKLYRKETLLGQKEYYSKIPKYFSSLDKYDENWVAFHLAKTAFLLNPSLKKGAKYISSFVPLIKDPLRKYFLNREFKNLIKNILYVKKN